MDTGTPGPAYMARHTSVAQDARMRVTRIYLIKRSAAKCLLKLFSLKQAATAIHFLQQYAFQLKMH